jgi:hydrogenase maturation protease
VHAVLVIGYGNELRGDDGLGPRVASAIQARNLPAVRVIAAHQLTPELAEPISQAEAVIFIDAAVGTTTVEVLSLTPAPTTQLRAHHSNPRSLLGLAHSLFGACPPAWWITVPAFEMEFGDGLSEQARASMAAALEAFDRLLLQVTDPNS